ncbi:CHAT domain-containing protein [Mycena rosella]|uniref:CHAT domain-containing protein n=1 Tax=Mycena rosella TaxID=1033263 RepID=A0AAD7FX79_MYCRO|nr:CHAT domain-containing protein [Mycena rosella]
MPPGHADLYEFQHVLGGAFRWRYRNSGNSGNLYDLEGALHSFQAALDATLNEHPDRPDLLHSIGTCLTDRYWKSGNQKDLADALHKFQEAVDLTPEPHPDRAEHLKSVAICLTDRYRALGDPKDLEDALENYQKAVDLVPHGHPNRQEFLQGLGVAYDDRYNMLGNLHDLEAGMQISQEALELTTQGHINRAKCLKNLALCLLNRYKKFGALGDIKIAFQHFEDALDLTPDMHPNRSDYLQSLALCLGTRYNRLGQLKDLERALKMSQEGLALLPQEHRNRARHLYHLAGLFRDRYERVGSQEDLEVATQNFQEAVELTLEGDPNQPQYLHGLAVAYSDRYKRFGDPKDLDLALQKKQESLSLTPEGHPLRMERLHNLAASLRDKYTKLGHLNDLEAALEIAQDVVKQTPKGDPSQARHLQSLAAILVDQYLRVGDLKDLEVAMQKDQEAVDLTPEGHPDRAAYLQARALSSVHQYKRKNSSHQIVQLLMWPLSIYCLSSYRMHILSQLDVARVTSEAARACINLSCLTQAVEIIEQGLATVFQQTLQLKTDADHLDPEQADHLRRLSAQLYSGAVPDAVDVMNERKELLVKIRKQPGLEYFLLPKPYSALQKASCGGPVVILTSHLFGCDGIIVLHSNPEPIHIALPNVTWAMLQFQQNMLKNLLELLTWLWTNVLCPIYHVLELHGVREGRVWWLPTGALTGLPLHACPPTNQFIHSYTSTLGSLLDAQKKKSTVATYKLGITGVAQTCPPQKLSSLKGMEQEVKKIIDIVRDPSINCLEGPKATVDAVQSQLQDCSWIHLACHGKQDFVNPTRSHLVLYDGILELETILRMPLSNAQFVFLTACQTAMGDAELVNESFHLGGAFMAAGFRAAIGTLWSMNDQDGPLVADTIYSHLFRNGRQPETSETAEVLHLAVKELKERRVSSERWIPFIHMGV